MGLPASETLEEEKGGDGGLPITNWGANQEPAIPGGDISGGKEKERKTRGEKEG